MKRILLPLSVALAAVPAAARAHAFLDRATPPVGGSVQTAPDAVQLWFSERLEPALSSVSVFDGAGKRVDRQPLQADESDRKHLTVPVAGPLAPGTYKVVWRAVSVDTHATTGDFTFSVGR